MVDHVGAAGAVATARLQAGSMRAAPTRKHAAPKKVPAMAMRESSTSSLLGTM